MDSMRSHCGRPSRLHSLVWSAIATICLLILLSGSVRAARDFTAASSDTIAVTPIGDLTSTFSISLWYYQTAYPTIGNAFCMVGKGQSGVAGNVCFKINFYQDALARGVHFIYMTTAWYGVNFTSTQASWPALNTWHHLVWTADFTPNPDVIKCYLDGGSQTVGLLAGSTDTTPPVTATQIMNIGSQHGGGEYWPGRIDNVLATNTILTDAQVTALYRGADARKISPIGEIEALWELRGIFDPEPDISNNRRNSTTITGTARANGPPTVPRW